MSLFGAMDGKTVSCGRGQQTTTFYVVLEVHDPVMRESLPASLSNDSAEALANSMLEVVRENRGREPAPKTDVTVWLTQLLASHGVRTETWNNGEIGMHNVPAKWAGIINDMTTAMQILAKGEPLPKLLPRGKGKVVR